MNHYLATACNSVALQSRVERLNLELQIAQFEPDKHLKEREASYPMSNTLAHGIFLIRETDDGWWRESIEFTGNIEKQIKKLIADPTVACAWINQQRFNEPGGWYDPS